jgi:dTDP-4-dehydrorhamnose 3,5-epimerase
MQMNDLAIEGAKLVNLQRFGDSRGSFCEAFRASWFGQHAKPWIQWNVSRSKAGVIRGLHLHQRQTDYWHIVAGTATVALVDVRPESRTRGTAICLPLCESNSQTLYVPPGVLHGFHAESDVILMYLLDQEYDASDEHGVRWDDPELKLPTSWYNAHRPVLSPRDAQAPLLKDLKY